MKSSVLFYAFQPRAEYEILNKCYKQRYEELGIRDSLKHKSFKRTFSSNKSRSLTSKRSLIPVKNLSVDA